MSVSPIAMEPISESNAPRAVAKLNGKIYKIIEYAVDGNAHGATASAKFDLTLSDNPDWTSELFRDANNDTPVQVEIWAGFPDIDAFDGTSVAGLSRRFLGVVDQYSLNRATDVASFDCKTLAQPLLNTKITTTAQNMNSQQFVTFYAQKVGLNVVFSIVGTPTTLQELWANEFVAGVRNMRVWDVITQLAKWDDADVWVDQDTLYYVAPSLVQRNILDLKLGRDLLDCTIVHSPQYNRRIKVEVRSYQPKTRTSFSARVRTNSDGTVTYSSNARSVTSTPIFGTKGNVSTTVSSDGTVTNTVSSGSGGSVNSGVTSTEAESANEVYTYYFPNISQARANALAQSIWRQISMHEYAVTLSLPVTQDRLDQLQLTSLVRLYGTGYTLVESSAIQPGTESLDAYTKANDYWPRRITEHLSENAGFVWSIEAVNHQLPMGAV